MSDKNYELGTEERQGWMDNYFFRPRGIGFTENGTVPLDSAEMSAYNIAKSCYQIYPEVFNLNYISEVTKVEKEEIKKRIRRMYDEHLIMFVMNPATQVYGWGLYYWVVKLKEGTTKEQKAVLSKWFQDKDDICTGYETDGEFDFFNGNHMRVLDNLLSDVIAPWKENEYVDYVHLCPIRRDVRESNVNMWDVKGDGYRKHVWGKDQIKKLFEVQDKIDEIDFAIIDAINSTESIGDMLDYDVLAQLSGLDSETMKKDLIKIVDEKRIILPMIYLNFRALGLSMKMYLIRLFQIIPSARKAEIVDELSEIPELNNVLEFSDSLYDIMVTAYNELTDLDKIRDILDDYGEIEEIKEADTKRQYRRWVCRLDDENGYWEECVFTDDFLQDRTQYNTVRCCNSVREGK
ncbi:AsnC family transcriptional regulator [Clostridium botulinum]|uniref:Lrp/AsnC family transcriptional regulator n=1 Tax=Clostridium TaxID=1485 RepID=UPI000596B12C|nr:MULTISPECIES: Lrp/AsnC family transcriptional regulator [Clostridium]KIL09303.1 AsnC family transcriptional regulator [Clostridium botulinum]MBN1054696.1 Lrp/AsnC family transcriptional regulator [Clostridium botulinum]MBN1057897.1 Lrp/AsnC family transcriptional regulator [Clostridium botulinum]MBN1061142.1 Lrp/AsnC family transcriptional regulator [Clostridium botulinum]MBY6933002.1 Lrp/AsnC family transcriptional regulator [Clostridium botulinum]